MADKIKRQKIVERETNFTYEEKVDIAKKSNERCCHCGKKVYFGYGATIEHFIPLSKGGTNRDINLVMLCEDCNKNKGDLIYQPEDYLEYLNKEHLHKMFDYFDSYIKSFDFVNRKNLLACDSYRVYVSANHVKPVYKKKNNIYVPAGASVHMVKRAFMKDVDRLTDYYIKYLKKYDCLDDENAARLNILFWLTFGCIYYVEKGGEIKSFTSITITKSNGTFTVKHKEIDSFLTLNVFTYYSNDYSLTLSYNMVRSIPRWIGTEQDIDCIPIKINVLKNDPISNGIVDKRAIFYVGDRFMEAFIVFCSGNYDENNINNDEGLKEFFNKFALINQENMSVWFENHDSEDMQWLIEEIMLPEIDKETDEEPEE